MRYQSNASHGPLSYLSRASGRFRLLAGVTINTAGALLLFVESYRYFNPGL